MQLQHLLKRLYLPTSTVLSNICLHMKINNWFSCSLRQQGHGRLYLKIGDWSPPRYYVLACFSGTLAYTAFLNLAQLRRLPAVQLSTWFQACWVPWSSSSQLWKEPKEKDLGFSTFSADCTWDRDKGTRQWWRCSAVVPAEPLLQLWSTLRPTSHVSRPAFGQVELTWKST